MKLRMQLWQLLRLELDHGHYSVTLWTPTGSASEEALGYGWYEWKLKKLPATDAVCYLLGDNWEPISATCEVGGADCFVFRKPFKEE